MRSLRLVPKRYQLKKEPAKIVLSGHPWIFRTHLSTAIESFPNGQWLKLVDAQNVVLGYGIYDKEGVIGIRVLKRGKNMPDSAWMARTLEKALARREQVKQYTNSFRAIHGENDSFPGVVIDVYGDTAVLQTYSPTVDMMGRLLAMNLRKRLSLKNVIWKFPVKRKSGKDKPETRVLFGKMPGALTIREGKLNIQVEIGEGQKSGTFLDLRGLRKYMALQKLNGLRVLNLFSYTGTLGLAAETAGAGEVWNVDISKGALQFAEKSHNLGKGKQKYVEADVFEWLGNLAPEEKFDWIIVDPPLMASNTKQVPGALKAYKRIYQSALKHLASKGTIVVCCCTSRIARKRFEEESKVAFAPRLGLRTSIAPEDDHPVGFSEGDYLKMLVFRGSPNDTRIKRK